MQQAAAIIGLTLAIPAILIVGPLAVSFFVLRREPPPWVIWGLATTSVCVWLVLVQLTGIFAL